MLYMFETHPWCSGVAVSNHTFANTNVECGNGSNATAILCGECGKLYYLALIN